MMNAVIFLALALAGFSAHSDTKPSSKEIAGFTRKAKALLVANFKDPNSVQYRNLFVSMSTLGMPGNELPFLCGEVNAKNSYGAYIGFRLFYADDKLLTGVKNDDIPSFDMKRGNFCSDKVADAK